MLRIKRSDGDRFWRLPSIIFFLFLFLSLACTLTLDARHILQFPAAQPGERVLMFPKMKTLALSRGLFFCVFLFVLAILVSCRKASAPDIKYSADPNADKTKTLLLKDFDPKPMLHVPSHEVPRAKFPVIDVHNHVNDAGGIHGEEIPAAEVVRRMDAANIAKIVILTGQWGDKLQGVIDKMVKPYPDRFIVFAQLDYRKIDDPDYSAEQVAQLRDSVRRGARGLKILKDLGLGDRDKSGKLVAIDDPRLDPIWEECGRLGIPVAIHTSDPEAFFTPLDAHNERFEGGAASTA
jgi:hypothetical protein